MADKKTATKAVKKAPAKKVAKKAAAPAKKAVAKKAAKTGTKKIIKDAATGDIVSKKFAEANPKTTMAITVPVDKTPNINEAALKREKAAKKAAAPAKKTAAPAKKAEPAKKAVAKKAPAKKEAGEKREWRRGESKPTKAFGNTHASLTSAAAAAHVPLETMQARLASKDPEFAHVAYDTGRRKK